MRADGWQVKSKISGGRVLTMTLKKFLVIPLVVLLITLVACAPMQITKQGSQCLAIKPVIAPSINAQGGISLTAEQTRQLMQYIILLEYCAGQDGV